MEKTEAIDNICGKLADRNAILFLGAGINANSLNKKSEKFPNANDLSKKISRDILKEEQLSLSLDQVAEMAIQKIGHNSFNEYLFNEFGNFTPTKVHNSIINLPWHVIYTTNYDLLIEKAAQQSKTPAGSIKTVVSVDTDITQFTESDILYYKLHGSIDLANTKEGRIIITKEDYRTYSKQREDLFLRLKKELINKTFIYIGYSFKDSNLLEILDECKKELDIDSFPLSYAIKTNITNTEKIFWKEKYNIEFIQDNAINFLTEVEQLWTGGGYNVISFEDQKNKKYYNVDDSARFPKVGNNYYKLNPTDCTGTSNAERFYKGGEPLWADVRDRIYNQRDAYDELLEIIWPELSEVKKPAGAYLVTGHAGTGKTALVKAFAYDLVKDFKVPVFIHISGTPLDPKVLASVLKKDATTRMILIINHAADYVHLLNDFLFDCKNLNLPLTIILEERKNQWNIAQESIKKSTSIMGTVHLGNISNKEINIILDSLTKHKLLGKLSDIDREKQVEYFESVSHKELLVALRELTLEQSFDDIIKDEFGKISEPKAREAYLYVSTVGQIDLPMRYEVLTRILEISFTDLAKIFPPTEGILISGEVVGNSRHNEGYNLTTRHPIIASIIFSTAAHNDDKKFEVINKILSNLDPGYHEDKKLLINITKRREFLNTFVSPQKKRAVYQRLATILPEDPYVYQHWALLEKDLENPSEALEHAKKCLSLDQKNNPIFRNTYGFVLIFVASKSKKYKERLIAEAQKIFSTDIKREPNNPFGYLGEANILKLNIRDSQDKKERIILNARLKSLLEEAFEATYESGEIASGLAELQRSSGDLKGAYNILSEALKSNPTDDRLRDALIKLKIEEENYTDALKIAVDGIKQDPTSWRLHRHIARCHRKTGATYAGIKGNYEAAIRFNKGSLNLLVELASYVFISKEQKDANNLFSQAIQMPMSSWEKHQITEWWYDEKKSKKEFSGKVISAEGGAGKILVIPDNFVVFFGRSRDLFRFKLGDKVKFFIGFNARGPVATNIDQL